MYKISSFLKFLFVVVFVFVFPTVSNGITLNQPQGKSFINAIKTNNWAESRMIFHEWAGYKAVWDGKWKALSNYPENKWELYDLSVDRTESNNLAKTHPEIVEKLANAHKNWASENEVADWNEALAEKTGFKK